MTEANEPFRIMSAAEQEARGIEAAKQAKTSMQNNVVAVQFIVGDNVAVDAAIVRREPDYNVGVVETSNEDGDRKREYVRLPKMLSEARHTVVEFYQNHEALAKGIGATAVAAGLVKAGSLVVRRYKH